MQDSFVVCSLGSANADLNFRVEDFPQEGETINASRSFILNGGKGANTAVAAGRLLGGRVHFAGQMGKDDKAAGLEKEMTTSGVNIQYCKRLDGVETGHAIILINDKGENIIIIVGGANMEYKDLSVLPEEYKKAIDETKILLLQREVPDEINILAAKYAQEKGKFVFLDVGGRNTPFPNELIQYLDVLSPNQTEMARLLSVELSEVTEELIRERLLKNNPKLKILLKLGSKGSKMITQDYSVMVGVAGKYNEQIGKDYKISSTVGAGDCLGGGFATAYYEKIIATGQPESKELFAECLLFGNTAAFLACTKEGAMASMPTRQVVDEFFAKYLKDVKL